MNSIWTKNIALFAQRFPPLAQQFQLSGTQDIPAELLAPVEILPAKNGQPTARENGIFFHSGYNPGREAETAVKNAKNIQAEVYTAVFYSLGLGYSVIEWAKKYPNDNLIIVETDPRYFFTALSAVDFESVFSVPNLIIALQADPSQVISLIEKCGGFTHSSIIANNAQAEHAKDYYLGLTNLINRNRQKSTINNATLEKFSHLWLRNSCRNLDKTASLDGVARYEGKCPDKLPALVLAAGPTLEQVLPHLKELKNKTIIIAVDTALRSCLMAGVEPDFIVLVDPQYYASRHIEGLSSKSSVLIAESAAYPSVFRFDCREIILCSALFPLGQYFEKRLGPKGELGAGGSVSTTAWDFARMTGAGEIYFAGLDLGYPDRQTHIRGSTFEEKSHTVSNRKSSAERAGIQGLFAAGIKKDKDYKGNMILTDEKMKMFSWWFESKCVEFPEVTTFTLSDRSLNIPGIKVSSVKELLEKPDVPELRKTFFEAENSSRFKNDPVLFQKTKKELISGLDDLYQTAKKGLSLSHEGLTATPQRSAAIMTQLEKIETLILTSELKDAASLVFPTERRLNEIFENTRFPQDPAKALFLRQEIIYNQLSKAIAQYNKIL